MNHYVIILGHEMFSTCNAPIQVLTRPDPAQLLRSDEIGRGQGSMAVDCTSNSSVAFINDTVIVTTLWENSIYIFFKFTEYGISKAWTGKYFCNSTCHCYKETRYFKVVSWVFHTEGSVICTDIQAYIAYKITHICTSQTGKCGEGWQVVRHVGHRGIH